MMKKSGDKLRIEDITEAQFAEGRRICQAVVGSQSIPADPVNGMLALIRILDGHWKDASGLYSGLASGLESGLRSGLDSGLASGLYSGLASGLDSGLASGLRSGLESGLYSGLVSGLASGLESGLRSGLDSGLASGLRSGLASDCKFTYCGVYWSRWLVQYLIAKMYGCRFDEQKLLLLRAFCLLCPIVGEAGNKPAVLPKPQTIRWRISGKTSQPFEFPIYELHGNGQPSVEYWGLFDLYHWHNTRIPERMGKVNCEHWEPKWVLDEPNAEVRRILIREIGYERLVHVIGATVRDRWREYELIELPVEDMPVRYQLLKMICPSTGDTHVLRAPPEIETAEQAITWCNHGHHPDEFFDQA